MRTAPRALIPVAAVIAVLALSWFLPTGVRNFQLAATCGYGGYGYGGFANVSSVVPSTGNTAGGNSVVINGCGFTGATSVHFNSTAASAFTVNSDTKITATAP